MKPSIFDRAAISISEDSLNQAERFLTKAKDALALTGTLTRQASAHPLPKLSPRLVAYRDHLIAKGAAGEMADITIDQLLQKGRAHHERAAELRGEPLRELDIAIAEFHEQTRAMLKPLETEAERLQSLTTAAYKALDRARSERQSTLSRGLEARRGEIMKELQAPHAPGYKLDAWHKWEKGEPPIAPMSRPGSDGN